MKRQVVTTKDGSSSIHIPEWNESYHSAHGAIQEAYHVFMDKGLRYFHTQNPTQTEMSILEIGFGTGLNALITLLEAEKEKLEIAYSGIEAYPVSLAEVAQLNYLDQLSAIDKTTIFKKMHEIEWEKYHQLTPEFRLRKEKKFFKELSEKEKYNLVFFDAFGARVQPELWTENIFLLIYEALQNGGIMVTYAAKGSAKRAMQAIGFTVEKLQGPPGKRHMLRATKE